MQGFVKRTVFFCFFLKVYSGIFFILQNFIVFECIILFPILLSSIKTKTKKLKQKSKFYHAFSCSFSVFFLCTSIQFFKKLKKKTFPF
jgi:hypothetical protein